MKKILRRIVAIITLSIFCLANIGYISTAAQTTNYGSDELIIKLKPGANVNTILTKHGGQLAKSVQKLNLHKIKLPKNSNLQDKMNALKKDPLIEYCQYNYQYKTNMIPNDTNYNLQWGLPKIKADQAWDISLGNNSITIAVLDTGVDSDHPDLITNLISGYNTVNNSTDTNDDHGHGTLVAGIAAGITNNGKGIAGVAGKSKIMPVKVLDSTGSGWITDIAEGVIWAADHGAKIINMSLGGTSYDQAFQDVINYAYNKGVLIVAAVGNSNTSAPSYPAAFDHVIAVAATDQNNNRATFSNYGPYVDLAAPGTDIYSTTRDGQYGIYHGNSMACPFVSGAAALVWSQNPSMSPDEVEATLESTAYDIGYLGRDANFGYGLVDVYKALKAIGSSPLPSSNPSATPSIPTSSTSIASGTPTPTPSCIPMGNIDKPLNNETISGTYTLSGWFLDGNTVSKIEVIIDENVAGEAVIGDLRTDIGSKYPYYKNNNSGFHYSLDASKLTNGSHTLTIRETSKTASQVTLPNMNINISNKPKTANINYYLSESSNVTVEIFDSQNNLIRALESNIPKPAGWNSSKWDGRDASGRIVPDGTYTYKVTAVDAVGLSRTISGTLVIERLAPSITSVTDDPDPFSPKDGEINTITFTLSENASTVVKVFSSNGTLIKTLINKTLDKGVNKVTWDGKNDGGKIVDNGKYTYTIDAVDSFKKAAQQVSGTIILGTTSFEINNYVVSPNPFTPTGSNSTTISYSTSDDAKTTVTIYDSSNKVVKILENKANKKQGLNSIIWDGKDANGLFVADGNYAYEVTGVDNNGIEAKPITGIINVANTVENPIISSVEDTPDPFAPDGQKTCSINFNLSENADVSIKIYNSNNNIIKTLKSGVFNAGNNTCLWDGKNEFSQLVSNGIYTYSIKATGINTNVSQEATGTITVDTIIPVISDAVSNPNPFSPRDDKNTTLSYNLSEDAKTTIEIYDAYNNPIQILEQDTDKKQGQNSVVWDGKNAQGQTVVDGNYTFKISAIDQSSLQAKPLTGVICVEGHNKPLVSQVNDTPDPLVPDGKINSSITFTLSEDANVIINITDPHGGVPKNLLNDTLKQGNYQVTWDGKNEAGVTLYSGIYTYIIDAVNLNNDKAQLVSGTITLDSNVPVISDNTLNPNPFIPIGTNTTTLSYRLSEYASTSITIYDKAGNLVKNLEQNVQKQPGYNTVTWDGRNSSGMVVSQSEYTYKITAVDYAGLEAKPATGTVSLLNGQEFIITGVSDSPDPFTPNGTNYNTIIYTISKDANVTIDLYNSKGELIKSLLNSTVSAGSNKTLWDGKNDAGNLVSNGTLTYKINATDASNNKAPEVSGTIVVDYTAPVINLLGVSPDPFKPGTNSVETILYSLSENANTTISIFDKNSTLVKVLEYKAIRGSGVNSSQWDGKIASGNTLPDGNYTFKIEAVNAAGLTAKPVTGTIRIASTITDPIITGVNDTPDPFRPDGTSINTISFKLSKNANTVISIFNSSNTLVKTILNTSLGAGSNSIIWDGKNSLGNIVPKGIYIYKIDVKDPTTNQTTQAIGTISVDFDVPQVIINGTSPNPFESLGNNQATLSYILTKESDVTIEVYNTSDTLIRALENQVRKLSGVNESIWDGKDLNGKFVDDGGYILKVTAHDLMDQVVTATGTLRIQHSIPAIISVSDSPDPFKTGAALNIINFTLTKDAFVTVKLFNPDNYYIKPLIESALKAGENSTTFNGRMDAGQILPDGVYTYIIEATDTVGNKALPVIGTITIDSAPPVISDIQINRIPFVPDGTSTVTILYTLSEPSKSSVAVYNLSDKLIRTLETKDAAVEGLNWAVWDGKDSSGNLVPEGIYTYKIEATDLSGNSSKSTTGSIKVEAYDTTVPTTIIDFEDDLRASPEFTKEPPIRSNITWNPDYGTAPKEVLDHRAWLNQKGIDISGTPNGFVWSTRISGGAGKTGVCIGFSSPNHIEWDGGVGVSTGQEVLTVNFINSLVSMVETEFTAVPSNEQFIDNHPVTVLLDAYDSDGNHLLSKSQNFMGVTHGTLTPVKVKMVSNNTPIAKITVQIAAHMYGGVYLESINFKKIGGSPSNDKVLPVITQPEVSLIPFIPDGNINNTIFFTLSEKSNTSVNIYNSANVLIKTLETNKLRSAGLNWLVWDGKDSKGNIVKEGTYTYKINATDIAGNSAIPVSSTMKVEKFDTNLPSNIVDFEDDPYFPGQLYYSPEYNLVPPHLKPHHDWLLTQKGIEITSPTPNSIVDVTRYPEEIFDHVQIDSTGNAVGIMAGILPTDGLLGEKVLKISFVEPIDIGEVEFTTASDKQSTRSINNIHATVLAKAYDANGKLIASKTQTFMGVTNNMLTPVKVKIPSYNVPISYITVEAPQSVPWGIIIESINFRKFGSNGNLVPPVIDKNSVNPNPFAPKPNESSTATISYNLSKDATVTLTIYDSTNSAVKVLEDNISKKSGMNTVNWDGRNTAGKLVKDGLYTYKITAIDARGLTAKVVTGTITVDGNAVITSVSDTPDPFSPTGTNFNTIKYNLSAEAKITVTIFDDKNNIIKTLVDGAINKASNTVTWDGKDNQGKFVSSGVYTYKIEATDTTRKTNAQVIGTITVQAPNINIVVPTITAVSDSSDPFGANGTDVNTIKYTLSTDATVTIKVYDSSSNLIKTLLNSKVTAGARSTTWDGRNDAGTLVSSDGVYTYKIDAVDTKGNKAVQSTGTITVDVTPPSIDQFYVEPPIFEPIE